MEESLEVGQVPGVGEGIDCDEVMLREPMNESLKEAGANESSSTCHKNPHLLSSTPAGGMILPKRALGSVWGADHSEDQ